MTTYRVSADPKDFHRVVSLMRDQGRKCPRMLWPVALAEDGPELVAAVGTNVTRGLVIAGPIVIADHLGRRAPVIAYRLGELYDRTMARCGIRRYYCYTGPELTQWQYVLERLGFQREAVEGAEGQWYTREAGRIWGQQLDSSHARPVDGLRQRRQTAQVDAL